MGHHRSQVQTPLASLPIVFGEASRVSFFTGRARTKTHTKMAAAAPTHLHIESIQTAVPTRVDDPGRSRRIVVAAPPLPAAALQRRFRAVLYYRDAPDVAARAMREETAWMKESLSEALAGYREMAGRLRRRSDGSWEVKLNDAGVRFLQASVETTMAEFLEAKDRPRKEAALATWTDVDAEYPDMCALFYLQLTRFRDGGYAIGISFSLLLSDPLYLLKFLKSWARTHAHLKAQNKLVITNPMIQYMNYLRAEATSNRIKSVPLDSFAAADDDAATVLFRATNVSESDHRALAKACIDQARENLGVDEVPQFSVFSGDLSGGMEIETCTGDGQFGSGGGHLLEVAQWDEFGLEELVLKENKPVHVSYTILTCGDEGLVVVMPAGDAEVLVSATVPK